MDLYEDLDFWDNIKFTEDIPDEFKTIVDYDSEWEELKDNPDYEISIYGEVYSKRTGKLLSQGDSGGYSMVVLSKNGKMRSKKVHRLVAETFLANPNNKPEVNHKDGNKKNNRVSNLEWNTRQENMEHAFRTGLATRSENAGSPKVKVRIIETGEVFNSISDCARSINANPSKNHIKDCMIGRRNTYKGYHYESVDNDV